MFDDCYSIVNRLVGTNSKVGWPRCGEMDIMEQVNGQDNGKGQDDSLQFGTLHYNQYGENSSDVNHQMTGGIVKQKPGHYWGEEFHLYQALWTPTTYTFMVDDLAYETIDLTSDIKYDSFRDSSNPFFFIVNLALGGNFPNKIPDPAGFPARFEVDWIRVWQQNSTMTPYNEVNGSYVKWIDQDRIIHDDQGLQSSKNRDFIHRDKKISVLE